MFLLDSSVLGPTLVCQGLDILVTAEASCEPCSATCLGSLWFMETDRRPSVRKTHRRKQLLGTLIIIACSK